MISDEHALLRRLRAADPAGREQEPDPVRRARIDAAVKGAQAAQRPPRRRVRVRVRGPIAGLAAAGLAAALVLGTVGERSGSGVASAAAVLEGFATQARTAPTARGPFALRLESRTAAVRVGTGDVPSYVIVTRRRLDIVQRADGSGEVRLGRPSAPQLPTVADRRAYAHDPRGRRKLAAAAGRTERFPLNARLPLLHVTWAQVRTLPAEPDALARQLGVQRRSPGQVAREAAALLALPLVVPATRAALYHVLARLPGARRVAVHDPLGRDGVAIGYRRLTLVFDRAGHLLATRDRTWFGSRPLDSWTIVR